MGYSFTVAGESFDSKRALQQRIKGILHGGDVPRKLADSDFLFMRKLLDRHPNANLKVGAGIRSIEVRQNEVYTQTRCFWALRVDGTETDFSYLECITPTGNRKKLWNACRVAIEPVMRGIKDKFFKQPRNLWICPITNQSMTFLTSHAHHCEPWSFDKLVRGFVSERGLNQDEPLTKPHGDGDIQDVFADAEIETQWLDYHSKRAVIQVQSIDGHKATTAAQASARLYIQPVSARR